MKSKIESNSLIRDKFVDVYRQVFGLIRRDPTLWILFAFVALADLFMLMGLFLSHSEPFYFLFAPIIKAFYGEKFLHYPANFLLLPKLYSHAHTVFTTFIGIVITGMVIKKIQSNFILGSSSSIVSAGGAVFKKYFSIFAAWILSYIIFRVVFQFVAPIFGQSFWSYMTATYLLGLLIQSLVVFLIPAMLISDTGFIPALIEGFRFAVVQMPAAVLLISVPMVIIAVLSYLRMMTPVFIDIYPEIVLGVLVVNAVVMAVVDLLITSSATVLYLKEKK